MVAKQYASAFFGTSLASTLRALDVDTVFGLPDSASEPPAGASTAHPASAVDGGHRPDRPGLSSRA